MSNTTHLGFKHKKLQDWFVHRILVGRTEETRLWEGTTQVSKEGGEIYE